jgi:hypothetical protein
MGSAVDTNNLTRELERYHQAGLGGVHIIPIYGAKGFEKQFISYLSPQWMQMMGYSVKEANRLGMGVDMTTGTGWCFGGPRVTDAEANASVVVQTFTVQSGKTFQEKFAPQTIQTLMAFSADGQRQDLTSRIGPDGAVAWPAQDRPWTVYAVSQKPSGQKVKRSSPGGQGHMLNLFYAPAMSNYLAWFSQAFDAYHGPKPRAMYHDSYEYRSDWAPDLFAAFQQRRGYRLQDELPALFSGLELPGAQPAEPDRAARVRADYRQTLSEIMAEVTLPLWAQWSKAHGFLTRNEAHGSPGNWLDLYAAADIPETEMFYRDRNKLISKFASSAAHVAGKPLASSETGTWVKEHFTETLADVKYLFDDMFLSGINHMFYHGTCYSPDEAPWPGWHFYASLEMNPRNSIWRDASAVNTYAARCQSVLQSGSPDNDILLYWPILDYWQSPSQSGSALAPSLTVHARDWFEAQPIGKTAEQLWNRGYAFDYISDRQLLTGSAESASVRVPGGLYKVIVVPPARVMPLDTLRQVLKLAREGATIIFQDHLPQDVPGLAMLDRRRAEFNDLLKRIPAATASGAPVSFGDGKIIVGELEPSLAAAHVARETMFDHPGLMCIRRAIPGGRLYFIANRSEQNTVRANVALATRANSVIAMDPLTGITGLTASQAANHGATETFLNLPPGQSIILRCLEQKILKSQPWTNWNDAGTPVQLTGAWKVQFIEGGPELPPTTTVTKLDSWTALSNTNAQRFAGTARYTLTFDAPQAKAKNWRLDLGKVCQSARVTLNGRPLGTLIAAPFALPLSSLKSRNNVLAVEVTSVQANRIRDLDRRGVAWKTFYDINVVGLDYKPFSAADWPLTCSGLLGPVTLTPIFPKP